MTISASTLGESFPVFSVLKFSCVGTFFLVLMLGAVATFRTGCIAAGQPEMGSVTNIQLFSPGTCNTAATAVSHACIHPALTPQVASWCGSLPAAAKEVGNLKCCQAVSAAALSRAHVPPYANGSKGVVSTAGFVKARFPQECRTGTYRDLLGLRFVEALQPTSPLMDDDTGLLDFLPEHSGGERADRHFAVGCLSVGHGVQTSGRVDVPGGDVSVINHKLLMPADALAAAAKST